MTEKPKQRGILEFNLEDFDAKRDFETCLKANSMATALWHIDEICRNHLKWDEDLTERMEKVLEQIRDECMPYTDLIE